MPKRDKPQLFPRLFMFLWSAGPVVLILGLVSQPAGETTLTFPVFLGALTTAAAVWYLWRLWPIRSSEWTTAWEAGRWGNKRR